MGLYNNRIVVKVGTSTLTNDAGKSDLRTTDRLACVLSDIQNMGYEVVLVSSGAIAVGRNKLNMTAKPDSMRMKQAAAAVGQCSLMYLYDKFFGDYDKTVAQILLNADDIEEEEKKENLINTFNALLEMGVIPIVNENDSVSYKEIESEDRLFGDNDMLSAVVAVLCRAKHLVIFSDIDGFYDHDPRLYPNAQLIDQIDTIDILDCNGGDHGYAFATNFNPEINLREVSAPGSYWEDGHWVEIPPMDIKREYNFDQVGDKDMYLLHHEEIESLAKTIPGVKRIRFFMTFGQSYLDHMRCLEDVGMLSTTPIQYNGQEIVPIQFLKALLPDPASLGPRTKGKTNIGCIFTGVKDGKEKTYYIYNVCDHQECYHEVGSQAISYTTGVPAMIGSMMVVTGQWKKPGVFNVEEFDPDPYMEALNKWGLPWKVCEDPELVKVWKANED